LPAPQVDHLAAVAVDAQRRAHVAVVLIADPFGVMSW
jgi:hypothetical protein